MAENPQPLTSTTINAIQTNAVTISNIANTISNATGISITSVGIAAPVAREMNKTQIDYPQIAGPIRDAVVSNQWEISQETGLPVAVGPATNDSLMQNYAFVQSHSLPNNTNTIEGIYNRLTNPVLNDIGPGKVQIGTAIGLLQNYLNDPRFANDPLDLVKYDGHVDQMVRDLNSNASPTAFDLTYKLSGLMNLQATEWYTSNQVLGQARWDQYTPEQQAQLITTYYSNGQAKMTEAAGAEIAKFGFYIPDLAAPGSIYFGSGSNIGVTEAALGKNGSIVTLPDGTTEYFDSNGKIIRQDSPPTLDPHTGLTNSTTKEFDQNNNVVRQTTRISNSDGNQSDTTQFAGSANPTQEQKTTVNATGTRTDDVTTFGQDGQRTGETIATTTADGTSSQIELINASGSITQVQTNTINTATHAVQPVGRISVSVIRRYDAQMADYAFGSIRPTKFLTVPQTRRSAQPGPPNPVGQFPRGHRDEMTSAANRAPASPNRA